MMVEESVDFEALWRYTVYGNVTAANAFKRFFVSKGECRDPEKLPPETLDKLICSFFVEAKKLDGKNYEPDSLSTMLRSFQCYLFSKKYSHNILNDEQFEMCRNLLKAKCRELTKSSEDED